MTSTHRASPIDSTYAWIRLGISLVAMTVASVGMYSVIVALPVVPFYLLWKLALLGRIVAATRPQAAWLRTPRRRDVGR